MKRIAALLTVLAIILSLAACGTQEAPAPSAAADPTLPAAAPTEAPGAFLTGSWVNLGEGKVEQITFHDDGTASVTTESGAVTAPFCYAGGTVTVEEGAEMTLRVVEENGVPHLKRDALSIDLVREEDAGMYALQVIDISMDNWEQYFELRFITHCRIELYDGVQYRSFGIGFMLKEEYLDRLVANGADVDVTVNYDSHVYEVENPFSLEYVITDRLYEWSAPKIDAIDMASVVDRRDPSNGVPVESDLHGQVAAFLATDGGYEEFPSTFYYHVVERMEVVAVSGTITLEPDL